MNPFASLKPFLKEAGRDFFAMIAVLPGGMSIALTQASSPNYRRLFWDCLMLGAANLLLSLVFFLKVRRWERWLIALISFLNVCFLFEMTLHVFFGIRLL